jgi:hypothetical protein
VLQPTKKLDTVYSIVDYVKKSDSKW